MLARTASDPAPMMSFDSTSVMPPLSLLPPLPGSRGRGRPPVPPAPNRRSVTPPSAPSTSEATAAQAEAALPALDDVWTPAVSRSLATVTRLPLAPLMGGPELAEHLFEPAEPAVETEPAAAEPVAAEPAVAEPVATVAAPIAMGEIADRLAELGVPRSLLGATFADDVVERGTYSALTRALALRLPKAPELPNGAGEVLFVVGPGVETLRAAQTLAASLRLDPDRVQWATRGDLAGLAPQDSRVTTVGAALDRRQDADVAGTVTIVAVDAPHARGRVLDGADDGDLDAGRGVGGRRGDPQARGPRAVARRAPPGRRPDRPGHRPQRRPGRRPPPRGRPRRPHRRRPRDAAPLGLAAV